MEVERRILRLLHGSKTRTRLIEIHAHFLRHHLHQCNQVLAHFVCVCGASNKMDYAYSVFCQTQNPNIFLFNSVIKGYSLSPPFGRSLHLFSVMRNRGIWPDEFTFSHLLKACSNLVEIKLGGGIHAEVLGLGFECYSSIRIGLVELYTKCGRMKDARKVFDEMFDRNVFVWNWMVNGFCKAGDVDLGLCYFRQMKKRSVVSWNSILSGFTRCGRNSEALKLFLEMRDNGFDPPDEFTFSHLLKVCSNLVDIKLGAGVHGEVIVLGFECYSSIRIGLVELYTKCGRMKDARKVFDEMFDRNVFVWNWMVHGFCKAGDVDLGLYYFRQMKERRSVVSWNSILSGLARCGRNSEALKLFLEMRDNGFDPDDATVVILLPVCADLDDDDVGEWIHSYAKSSQLFRDFVAVGNSLIDYYCKRGVLETAFSVFNDMPQKNVVSWNAIISGQAYNGYGERVIALFEEMINEQGVIPDSATFVGVLSCCSHAGLVKKGGELLSSMVLNYNIHPKLEHYGCMVDLLGRSGCVKEAYDLIKTMPLKPNAAIWGTLLSACRQYDDMELAVVAVQELINLEPWNSGKYLLLSNIYAEKGKWNEVEKIRLLMKKKTRISTRTKHGEIVVHDMFN